MKGLTLIATIVASILLFAALAYAGYTMCDERGCKYCTVSPSGTVICY